MRVGNALGLKKQVRECEIYRYKSAMRNLVYGSVYFCEYLHKRQYELHNASVIQEIPEDRLLVMNIHDDDGWGKLCPFLGVDIPEFGFPHIK